MILSMNMTTTKTMLVNSCLIVFSDQVTDMMVANSSNLIVTVKPANQRTLMGPRRGSFSRNSAMSSHSMLSSSTQSGTGSEDHEEDEERDEIVDHHHHHGSSFHSHRGAKPVLHL